MALTARPEDQARLLDLQTLDTRLQQLAHRARTLPQRATIAELGAEADVLRQRLAERLGAVEDDEAEIRRIESDVALVEARRTRDSERLQHTSSVKDVQALEQELTALQRRQSDLEDIELEVMERLDIARAARDLTARELDELADRLAAAERERDAELEAIEQERQLTVTNRNALAASLPEDLVALYDRQRERYGIGASHLQGGVSSASGVRLTESDMADIRAAAPDAVVICPDSSAILVRTAESGL